MAGFFGGVIDLLVVRFIEIFMSFLSVCDFALLAFVERPSIFRIGGDWLLGWTGVAHWCVVSS